MYNKNFPHKRLVPLWQSPIQDLSRKFSTYAQVSPYEKLLLINFIPIPNLWQLA